MPRFLMLVLICSFVLISFLEIARLIGAQNRSMTLLSDYMCSPEPCWQGIYPKTMSIGAVVSMIQSSKSLRISSISIDAQGSGQFCWNNSISKKEMGCFTHFFDRSEIVVALPNSPFR